MGKAKHTMGKEMTLDVLSSIKGASASKVVEDLFEVIKKGHVDGGTNEVHQQAVEINDLRPDKVINCNEAERNLIIENFPIEKNGFLVVPKVIEE